MTEFKAGDVVRLKSDSVPMTVEGYDPELEVVHCVWRDGASKLQERAFIPDTLVKYAEDISDAV